MSIREHTRIQGSANAQPAARPDGHRAPPQTISPPTPAPRFWWVIALAFTAFAVASVPLVAAATSGRADTAGALVPVLGAIGGLALWLQGMWSAR